MDSLTLAIVVVGLIVLIVQAGSCFLKAQRSIAVGLVDLLLAALIASTTWAVQSGRMVLAKDFGAVMVQDGAGKWLLRLALISVAILPAGSLAKLLHFKQKPQNKHRRRILLIAIPALAAVAGVAAAAFGIVSINPDEPGPLQVFQYDIWWPPLILWLTACLSASILVLADEFGRLVWVSFGAAWTTVLASFALQFEDLPGPSSRIGWTVVWPLSFAVCLGILAYNVWNDRRTKFRVFTLLALAALLAGFLAGPADLRVFLGMLPLAMFLWAVAQSIAGLIRRGDDETPGSHGTLLLPRWNVAGIAIGFALPVVAVAVADLFSAGFLPPSVDVVIALLFWLLFAERLAEHALNQLPRLFVDNKLQVQPLFVPFRAAAKGIRAAAPAVNRAVTFIAGGTVVTKIIKAALLPLLILMAVAALNEVFNYGKIVVSSFVWLGDKDAKDDTAAALAPGIINALGRLHDDLRADLIEAKRNQSRDHPGDVSLLSTGTDTSLSSSVAQSGDLEIGGVKVPLSFLASPVQVAMRKLLNVEVIDGSVRKVGDGEYVVIFNSSRGKSWVETLHVPVTTAATGAATPGTAAPPGAPATAPPAPSPSSPPCDDPHCASPPAGPDSLSQGIETISFDIASGEPAFLALGLSQNGPAVGSFRAGLRSWHAYLESEDPADLDNAIKMFRAAVRLDHGFALAYYRLGLCLRRDGQPAAAIDEFRASYQANPDFVPAATWAARTLYSLDTQYPPQPAGLPLRANAMDQKAVSAQRREAMEIWSRLAGLAHSGSPGEFQKTYYGLCQYELDSLITQYRSPPVAASKRVYFVPYFFCRQADAIFNHLAAADRGDLDTRTLRAVVLNEIGEVLDLHRQERKLVLNGSNPRIPPPRACQAESYHPADILSKDKEWPVYLTAGRTRQALRYYRRSLALVPGDPRVECNAAMAQTVLDQGDPRFLSALESDATVRDAMAADLEYKARGARNPQLASRYFAMALEEHESALNLNPAFFNALNNYAYTCWEWYLSFRRGAAADRPGWKVEMAAELYAREAVRLAYERQDKLLVATALDTLGEVLIEKGRYSESILNLERAIARYDFWPASHETHWDLAVAELCAADQSRGDDQKAHFQKAYRHLGEVRQAERTQRGQLQEWRPFNSGLDLDMELHDDVHDAVHDATDPERRAACPASASAGTARDAFVMQDPEYSAGQGCGLTAVTAVLESGTAIVPAPYFHVWGGNTNDRVPLQANQLRSIQLDVPVDPNSGSIPSEYYAALEMKEGGPLSQVRSFHVYPVTECQKNWIKLTFRPSANHPSAH